MTSPKPPGAKSRPQPFNPATRARSVIALPLLEQIEAELAITAMIKKDHSHIHDEHNAATSVRATEQPNISKPDPSISTAVPGTVNSQGAQA